MSETIDQIRALYEREKAKNAKAQHDISVWRQALDVLAEERKVYVHRGKELAADFAAEKSKNQKLMAVVVQLAKRGPFLDEDYTSCVFCGELSEDLDIAADEDKAHKTDCAWVLAKALAALELVDNINKSGTI